METSKIIVHQCDHSHTHTMHYTDLHRDDTMEYALEQHKQKVKRHIAKSAYLLNSHQSVR